MKNVGVLRHNLLLIDGVPQEQDKQHEKDVRDATLLIQRGVELPEDLAERLLQRKNKNGIIATTK